MMLLVVLAISFPQQVLAHASVTESLPAQNEVLEQSPKQIMIRFNEDIQRAYYGIKLYRSSTEEVGGIKAYIDPQDGTRLLADLPSTLPEDIYTVSWKAISGDGHPVEGAIIFQVGNGAGKSLKDATSVALEDSRPLNPLLVAMRWIQYAAQAMVLGALCLPLFLLPRSARSEMSWLRERRYTLLALSGAVLTVLALAAQLPLRIAWTAGIPLSTVGGELGNTFSGTVFGQVWLLQMAAAVIVLLAVIVRQLPGVKVGLQRGLGLTALIVLALGLLAKAFDGHAYAATLTSVAIAADYLHLLSALLWSGALLVLALFLPRIVRDYAGEERRQLYWGVVRRFSWLAIGSVAALLVTGIYGSLIYLPTLNSLFTTGYGLTLLSKMLLFLVMAGFGGMNYVKARNQKDEIGKDMIWEVLTGFVILVLAALLVHLSPYAAPLGNGGAPREVQAQVQQVDGYEISLRVPPSRMGMNTFEVMVMDSQGKPVDVEQITMQLHHLDMAMAPTDITITSKDRTDNMMYETQGMISMNGNWQVDMTVLTSKLDSIQTKFVLKVPGS